MIIFLKRDEKLNLLDYLLLLILGYFEMLALSKSGIITYAFMFILLFFTPKATNTARIIAAGILICISSYGAYNASKLQNLTAAIKPIQNVVKRLGNIGQEQDDSPEARGYYRLIRYPQYTLLGAGEGAFRRFPDDKGYVRELHSGIATIIFSYGITGALVFFTFLALVMNRQPWYYILLFMPIILFGLPHQNFRFAHFWVLLGLNYGLAVAHREQPYKNDDSIIPENHPAPTPEAHSQ